MTNKKTILWVGIGVVAFFGVRYLLKKNGNNSVVQTKEKAPTNDVDESKQSAFAGDCGCGA